MIADPKQAGLFTRPLALYLMAQTMSGCGLAPGANTLPNSSAAAGSVYSFSDVYALVEKLPTPTREAAAAAFGQKTFTQVVHDLLPSLDDGLVTIGDAEFTGLRSQLAAVENLGWLEAMDKEYGNLSTFWGGGRAAAESSPFELSEEAFTVNLRAVADAFRPSKSSGPLALLDGPANQTTAPPPAYKDPVLSDAASSPPSSSLLTDGQMAALTIGGTFVAAAAFAGISYFCAPRSVSAAASLAAANAGAGATQQPTVTAVRTASQTLVQFGVQNPDGSVTAIATTTAAAIRDAAVNYWSERTASSSADRAAMHNGCVPADIEMGTP